MNGCGTGKTADIQNPYSLTGDNSSVSNQFFARNLCVTNDINFGTDQVHADYAEGAGVFDLTTKEVLYSQNLFEKLYPASTTKILTAYIIIRTDGYFIIQITVADNDIGCQNFCKKSVCDKRY